LPYSCISDAGREVRTILKRMNKKIGSEKKIFLVLKIEKSTSWLEIHLLNQLHIEASDNSAKTALLNV